MNYDDIILVTAKDAVVAVPAVAAATTFSLLDISNVLTIVSLTMGIILMSIRFYYMGRDIMRRRRENRKDGPPYNL